MSEKITKGHRIANSVRPFIAMESTDIDATVIAIGNDIDKSFERERNVVDRANQLLSCLEYEKLTDYQCRVVLLLQKEINLISK